MKKFKNILIIGLGMMGGSLCKSIKKNNVSEKISGYDVDVDTLEYAKNNKIIDFIVKDYDMMPHPDLIILCTPIGSYKEIIKNLVTCISKKTLLSDIGSSKGKSHTEIHKILRNTNLNYISSHPMVGSEKAGIGNYINDMYEDKPVFIIDKNKSSKGSYLLLKKFWKSLGSTPYDIDYKKHDLLMSQTSHIAHLMAFIFVQSLPQSIITKNLPILLGGGIKEHIRLSKSDPKMWTDIFINNKVNITKALDRIQKNTSDAKKLINSINEKSLYKYLKNIQNKT
ncbi:MAG: prephenate dehydrogenase [Pseudomonadota bacterium]|nr:prephenate dehydrogenase [Pseudomonadota bacterium]